MPGFQKKLANAMAKGIRSYLAAEYPVSVRPIEPWAKEAIAKAVAAGLTDGKNLTVAEQRVLIWLDHLDLIKPKLPGQSS